MPSALVPITVPLPGLCVLIPLVFWLVGDPFGIAAVPATFVPMKLLAIRLSSPQTWMASCHPEITLCSFASFTPSPFVPTMLLSPVIRIPSPAGVGAGCPGMNPITLA